MPDDESTRSARLLDAQAKAARLFMEIEERGGVRESGRSSPAVT
ncbi:hypothetical protein [Streptomyces sp. NPDC001933]